MAEKSTADNNCLKDYMRRKALAESFLGKTVRISIDRPIGSVHPKYKSLIYPINYGFIPNVWSEDGEELDVYLLGVDKPKKSLLAKSLALCIAKMILRISLLWRRKA